MSFALHPLLVVTALAAALIGIFITHRKEKAHVRDLQLRATRAFRESKVKSTDQRYEFSGDDATIVGREETGGSRGVFEHTADFAVTIYALNPHGESFLFKWCSKSAKPFIKHLPHGKHLTSKAAQHSTEASDA